MRSKLIRKIIVALIILVPVFSYPGCKKQAKCGCGKDLLFNLTSQNARVYFNESGTTMYFQTLNDPYSTYNFCNPGEMLPLLSDSKSGDILMVSGEVFWDCNYVYQQSNYSYQSSYYKVYQVIVTDLVVDLYGK